MPKPCMDIQKAPIGLNAVVRKLPEIAVNGRGNDGVDGAGGVTRPLLSRDIIGHLKTEIHVRPHISH